jgi:hypothetical protein
MRLIIFAPIIVTLFILGITTVDAECIKTNDGNTVCSMGKCEQDLYGRVYCISPGGDIESNDNDKIYCGIGECVADDNDKIWCSKVLGGGAAKNSYGKVKCYGGCVRGNKKLCVAGK